MRQFFRNFQSSEKKLQKKLAFAKSVCIFVSSITVKNAEEANDFIEGLGHVRVLNGLCGFPISADNEEEAIDEAIDAVNYKRQRFDANSSGEEFGRHAYLFEGAYTGDCIDGDLFRPIRVVGNITEIA